MKGINIGKLRVIYWIIIVLLFFSYFIFLSLNYEIISKLIYVFIIVFAAIGFVGAFVSLYIRFKTVKFLLKIKQEKEKNIREFYEYEKFIDPPDYNLNN